MAEIILNRQEYRDKVLACWLGKNIGGTLGAPFEWKRQVNNVSFYTQELTGGQPLPNDDLDIQLLWLIALEEAWRGPGRQDPGRLLVLYVTPHWAEYGNGKINMRPGLVPPISGTVFNDYKHSCGSYIRTEIWACIAPGLPRAGRPVRLPGRHSRPRRRRGHVRVRSSSPPWKAPPSSTPNLRQLIDIGLSYIPADCGIAKAVHTAIKRLRQAA